MNEQELMNNIENASTMEEMWEIASQGGMDKATFDAMVEAAEKEQGDEISDAELENVSGGSVWGVVVGFMVAKALYKKVKKIRNKRFQEGYDEEIMSDNRLGATCENRK